MSKNNNDRGLIEGIVLITVGIIALLVIFLDVEIIWSELLKLWPVFIIIFGLSVMPLNKILKSLLVVLLILASCVFYCMQVYDNEEVEYYDYSMNEDADMQEYNEAYNDNIRTVDFNIDYGAGDIRLLPPVDMLVKINNISNFLTPEFFVKYEDEKAEIDFEVDNASVNSGTKCSNLLNIALNENPVYDFDINVGACSMTFDMSHYKVSDLDIEAGASDIDIKVGELYDEVNIILTTGVSDINIKIPEDSGCRIVCESVMSNKDFVGFNKKSNDTYETSNYKSAANIVNIRYEGAISDFTIDRY